jgi:hypothetical protein
LRFFKKTCKGLGLLLPELPVTLDPFSRILHGFSHQAAAINSSILAPRDKLCPLQHSQVLGHPGEGDVIGRGQVADGGFALGQARQDAAPGSVGKRGEGGVESEVRILNHMV